jgi:hypothetical protein
VTVRPNGMPLTGGNRARRSINLETAVAQRLPSGAAAELGGDVWLHHVGLDVFTSCSALLVHTCSCLEARHNPTRRHCPPHTFGRWCHDCRIWLCRGCRRKQLLRVVRASGKRKSLVSGFELRDGFRGLGSVRVAGPYP